ncbi:MAG: hypothetical protein AAF413_02335 [Patescibacteria group bacterium]
MHVNRGQFNGCTLPVYDPESTPGVAYDLYSNVSRSGIEWLKGLCDERGMFVRVTEFEVHPSNPLSKCSLVGVDDTVTEVNQHLDILGGLDGVIVPNHIEWMIASTVDLERVPSIEHEKLRTLTVDQHRHSQKYMRYPIPKEHLIVAKLPFIDDAQEPLDAAKAAQAAHSYINRAMTSGLRTVLHDVDERQFHQTQTGDLCYTDIDLTFMANV